MLNKNKLLHEKNKKNQKNLCPGSESRRKESFYKSNLILIVMEKPVIWRTPAVNTFEKQESSSNGINSFLPYLFYKWELCVSDFKLDITLTPK